MKAQSNLTPEYYFTLPAGERSFALKERSIEDLIILANFILKHYECQATKQLLGLTTTIKLSAKPDNLTNTLVGCLQNAINNLHKQHDGFKAKYSIIEPNISSPQELSLSSSIIQSIIKSDAKSDNPKLKSLTDSVFGSLTEDILSPILESLFTDYDAATVYIILTKTSTLPLEQFESFLDILPPSGDYDIRPNLKRLKEFYDGSITKFISAHSTKEMDPIAAKEMDRIADEEIASIADFLKSFFTKVLTDLKAKNKVTLDDIDKKELSIKRNFPDILWRSGIDKLKNLDTFSNQLAGDVFIYYVAQPRDVQLHTENTPDDARLKQYGEKFVQALKLYLEFRSIPLDAREHRNNTQYEINGMYDDLATIERYFSKNQRNYKHVIKQLKNFYSEFNCIRESRKAHYRAFLLAVNNGDDDLKNLSAQHLQTDPRNHPFIIACRFGFLNEVQQLLEEDPKLINEQSYSGYSALGLAIKYHHNYVCHHLLANEDLSIYAPDSFGNNMLHIAIQSKNYEISITLLNSGLDPNHVNKNGQTALDIAFNIEDDFLIRFLLDKNAKYNCFSSRFTSFFHTIKTSISCTVSHFCLDQHPVYIANINSSTLEIPGLRRNQAEQIRD